MTLSLFQCRPEEIDRAWRDGASQLSEATKWASREITTDQLKMLLSRGERTLLGARDDTGIKGWCAVQVQQLPNLRTLYVYALAGEGVVCPEGFGLLREYAKAHGCSTVRGAVRASMGRMLAKLGGKPLYQVFEMEAT